MRSETNKWIIRILDHRLKQHKEVQRRHIEEAKKRLAELNAQKAVDDRK